MNIDTKQEFILSDVRQFDTIFNVKSRIAEHLEIDVTSFKLKYKAKTLELHHNLYDYLIKTDEIIFMSAKLNAGGAVKRTRASSKPSKGVVTLGRSDDEEEVEKSHAKEADETTPALTDVRGKVEQLMSLLKDHEGKSNSVGEDAIKELKKGLELVDKHGEGLMKVIFSTMDKTQVRNLTAFSSNNFKFRVKADLRHRLCQTAANS